MRAPDVESRRLARTLQAKGFNAFYRPNVVDFLDLTGVIGVVDVHEHYPPVWSTSRTSPSSGKTFSVHSGAGLFFVGTWAPREYLLMRRRSPAAVVRDVLSNRQVLRFSEEFCRRSGLREVWRLQVCPRSESTKYYSRIESLEEEECVVRAFHEWWMHAPVLFDDWARHDPFVRIKYGHARALTRWEHERRRASFQLVMLDSPDTSADVQRMLAKLTESLPCNIYLLSEDGRRIV